MCSFRIKRRRDLHTTLNSLFGCFLLIISRTWYISLLLHWRYLEFHDGRMFSIQSTFITVHSLSGVNKKINPYEVHNPSKMNKISIWFQKWLQKNLLMYARSLEKKTFYEEMSTSFVWSQKDRIIQTNCWLLFCFSSDKLGWIFALFCCFNTNHSYKNI